MKNFKHLSSTICLISVFVLIGLAGTGTAHGFAWYGFSEICFDGSLKGPAGDVLCTVTLTDVVVKVACDNENSNENSGQCSPGEAHSGDLVQTVEPTGTGTKVKNLLNVNGCYPLDIFDEHYLQAHLDDLDQYHGCDPASIHMIEVPGSAYMDHFVAEWTCYSISTGNVIQTGRDTCNYTGTVDEETCIPTHGAQFDCNEELLGKKYTFE